MRDVQFDVPLPETPRPFIGEVGLGRHEKLVPQWRSAPAGETSRTQSLLRVCHAFVYILESADGTLYVGQSHDVRERLGKHRLGLGRKHTHDHPDIRLVYVEGPWLRIDAVRRERQLTGWTRAKKLALISGDVVKLKQLSRGRD